jgi:hypothetical protein
VQKRLEDLVTAHSAIIALLESLLLSPAHRRRLEGMRDNLEREMALLKTEQPPKDMAAD